MNLVDGWRARVERSRGKKAERRRVGVQNAQRVREGEDRGMRSLDGERLETGGKPDGYGGKGKETLPWGGT